MAVQAISWVLDHSASTGATRCVLISIANHVGPDGEGWVYVKRVMAEANCSRDTYERAVRWAEEHGELERDVRQGGSTRTRSDMRPNLFRFPSITDPDRPLQSAGVDADERPPQSAGDPLPQSAGVATPAICGVQESRPLEPSGEPSTPVVPIAADRFDKFWGAYPKRVGKGAARRSWDKAVKAGVPPEQIISAVEEYAAWLAAGAHPDVDFCPPAANPATWLNQQRWLDELPVHRVRANRESRTRGAIVGVVSGGGSSLSLKERMAALNREPQQAIGGPR